MTQPAPARPFPGTAHPFLENDVPFGSLLMGKRIGVSTRAAHFECFCDGRPAHAKVFLLPDHANLKGVAAWAKLNERGLLRLYSAARVDGHDVEVSERLDGTPLSALAKPLSADHARRLVDDIGGALLALHGAGYVHGGVCPSNILFSRRGFVLAGTGSLCKTGTPRPQTDGRTPFDPPVTRVAAPDQDVFSLALTVWYALGLYSGKRAGYAQMIAFTLAPGFLDTFASPYNSLMDERLFRFLKCALTGTEKSRIAALRVWRAGGAIPLEPEREYCLPALRQRLDALFLEIVCKFGVAALRAFRPEELDYDAADNPGALRAVIRRAEAVRISGGKPGDFETNLDRTNIRAAVIKGIVSDFPASARARRVPASVREALPPGCLYCVSREEFHTYCADVRHSIALAAQARRERAALAGHILLVAGKVVLVVVGGALGLVILAIAAAISML
jgi:hypothetical protein